MAANEDELRLRLTAETLGYRKAWADVRVQTAKDLASIKSTVTTSLNQTRVAAAQSLSGIRQAAATNLSQTRVNTAQQLSQIRVNTAQQLNQIRQSAQRTLSNMGSQFESAGRRMSVGLTLPLVALGAAAVKSAKDIDAGVNVLKVFTGSTEAAEKRLAQLVATAQKTPGLTTNLALQLDSQLRVAQVTEETINRILPAIGRLNALSPIQDTGKFVTNLQQLATTGFQKRDLRELVNNSRVAGQVITELFNVDSPLNAEAIRKSARRMGIVTADDFFAAFADAAARNKGLANVTESIGTRIEKLPDRVTLALRPLGVAIVDTFTPILDVVLPIIEKLGSAFNSLPTPIKAGIVVIGGLAAAIGPVMILIGSLISTIASLRTAFVTLNTLGLLPTITNMRAASQAVQGGGSAAAVAAGGWVGLGAAIAAAVAVSLALARATDGYLESLKGAHPWVARFGQAVLGAFNPLYGLLKGLGLVGPETEKVAAAQAKAVPAIKNFSDAADEESESLKQLRRALAEVELATKSRVAAAQRGYNEERLTLAQFTQERIQALEAERAAELKRIDAALEARRKEVEAQEGRTQGLGPHGSDDKELRAVKEDIEKLELDRKKIISESNTEIENIRSDARKQERDAEERHRESLLAVQRTNAEAQIDVLRDAAERNEALGLDSEKKIVAIEKRLTDAEIAEVRLRLEAATQGTEARAQLEDELAQKLAASGRQRAEQARRIAKAELEAALLPVRREGLKEGARDAGDGGVIARLRSAAELNRALFESTEEQIGKIVDAGFARRIKTLKGEIAAKQQRNLDVSELDAQLAQLEQDRVNAQEGADRATEAGRQQDLERARDYRSKLASIRQSVVDTVIEMRDRLLDIGRRTIELRRPLNTEERRQEVEHQAELAHVKLAARQASVLGEIQDEINRLERKKSLNATEVEQLKALHEALRAEEERFKLESEDIELRRQEGLKEAGTGGLFGPLKDGWEEFKRSISDLGPIEIFAQTLGQAFANVREAVLGAVDAMIFSGKSLKAALADAFKSVLAQTAAYLGKKAFLKALEALAEAATHFALGDFVGGARWLGAAAAWGALGVGVSALGSLAAGRGGAGALADSGTSGGAASSSASGAAERDRSISEPRRGGMSDPNQAQAVGYMMVDVKHDDGHVERQMVKVWKRMGEFRDTVMAGTVGTAPSY